MSGIQIEKTVAAIIFVLMCGVLVRAEKVAFTSPNAKMARVKYTQDKAKAEKEYQAALRQARLQYQKSLSIAQTIATKSNRLDEAVAIRDEIQQLDKEIKAQNKPPKTKNALNALIGTTWRPASLSDPRRRTFHADGTWDDGGRSQTPRKAPAIGVWRKLSKNSYELRAKHSPNVKWGVIVTGDTLTFQASGTPKYVWTRVSK